MMTFEHSMNVSWKVGMVEIFTRIHYFLPQILDMVVSVLDFF